MQTRILPTIVVVAYNRADSLKRLLESIAKAQYPCKQIRLIISIDYHPENADVIQEAESFVWEYGRKEVHTHQSRMGLRPHVLECGDYSLEDGCVIILEDDILVAEDYYYYSIEAQKHYYDNNKIAGVALYSNEWNDFSHNTFKPIKKPFDIYFRQYCESWGQSWTKEQWTGFRKWLSNNINMPQGLNIPQEVYNWSEHSWGKYFTAYVVENNLYTVVPYTARSTCFSEIGQHTNVKAISCQVNIQYGIPIQYLFPSFEEGVHYDIFFENNDIKNNLQEWIGGENVCIDINGLKQVYTGKYLLTTKKMSYRRVVSFALEMQPPENNIIWKNYGNDIHLYDTNTSALPPKTGMNVIEYDLTKYNHRDLIRVIVNRTKRHFKKKLYSHSNSVN